jgi:hypothetical protein
MTVKVLKTSVKKTYWKHMNKRRYIWYMPIWRDIINENNDQKTKRGKVMSRFCRNCGAPITEEDAFCKTCGAKVDEVPQMNANAAAPAPPPVYTPGAGMPYVPAPPKKSRLGLILGIVGGVVVIGAVLLVLFLMGVLGGGVDYSDIEGKWYSSTVMIDFDDDGTLRIVTDEDTIRGEFTYDPDKEEGVIMADDRDYDDLDFALNRDTLIIDDVEYYRDRDEAGYGEDTETVADSADETQADAQVSQQIIGLWHVVEATYQGETQDVTTLGVAFEFTADGVTTYESYEETGSGAWGILDGVLTLTASDGDVVTFENIVMDLGGAGFTADVTTSDGTGSMTLTKTDHQTFGGQTSDLALLLQGFWQVCGTDEYPPMDNDVMGQGMAIAFNNQTMDVYSYFKVETSGIVFDFVDADTIRYNESGDEYTANIGFKTIAGREYLLFGSDGGTLYLIPSTYSDFMGMAGAVTTPEKDTQYSSDDDVRALIVREWNVLYYLNADGSQEEPGFDDNMVFYMDGTFEEMYGGEPYSGVWTVDSGVLTMSIDEAELWWPVYIEFSGDMQAYLLYCEVVEDGVYTGKYVVYTDYQP